MNSISGKLSEIVTHSPEETALLGFEFARKISTGDIVGLAGELGTGKTQFVKGICEFFGVDDKVTSPTFNLVNQYRGRDVKINHFDLYRMKNISEFKEIGFDHYNTDDSICLIEWPETAERYLNYDILKVTFDHGKNNSERIISYPDF
ncbi:MAG TPA: tRNA (adenosine(37)-N6)-threonylcarbamoyltransferase complex ATPase subunit type 1 TsaE [Ignavibacteria bacterium]|nr:tRNA (adenosine(37)-N6)-threonylcarbamoyltransferase complex ATPase subunit type 1 TsaE [Ignavibacteria bacterium]HMR40571.1 tRNA (adenosine(37)-N6)-threonylcarbamoyltransferase complex ATPase subunit type 1 TsaE [Ignavibacteria bacterium]